MKPKFKRKKLRKKPRVLSIEQRREMLRGVTWRQFYESESPASEVLRIDNLRFKGGFGLFLGQPALAVANNKEFIVVQYIKNGSEFLANTTRWNLSFLRILNVTNASPILGEAMDTVAAYRPELMDKYVIGPKL